MKVFLFFLLLLFSFNLASQNLSKSDLRKSIWLTDNKDSVFYRSETINIISILKSRISLNKKERISILYDYLNNWDKTELQFKSLGRARILDHDGDGYVTRFKDNWRWKFSKKEQEISIFFKHKIFHQFEIIADSTITLKVRKNKIDLRTLTLKRIK